MASRVLYIHRSAKSKKPLFARRRFRRMAMMALLTGLLTGSIAVIRGPFFRISTIEVSGAAALAPTLIREQVQNELDRSPRWFIPGNFFFAIRAPELIPSIQTLFPRIENLEILKKFPHTLRVTLHERTMFGILCNGLASSAESTLRAPSTDTPPPPAPECAYVDRNGFAYEQAPTSTGALITKIKNNAPHILVGASAIDQTIMQTMEKNSAALKQIADIALTGFELRMDIPSEVRAIAAEGFAIYLKTEADPRLAARALKEVLEREIGKKRAQLLYIDARLGNKIFYKLRSPTIIPPLAPPTQSLLPLLREPIEQQ